MRVGHELIESNQYCLIVVLIEVRAHVEASTHAYTDVYRRMHAYACASARMFHVTPYTSAFYSN